MSLQGCLHLVIGPVGGGKSTFASRRAAAERAVFLDLDSTMVRLYGDDTRPAQDVITWYMERRARCHGLLWDLAQSILECGTDVYLELGLVQGTEREAFYKEVRGKELELKVYLLDAPREVRRERVLARNNSAKPYTQKVPPEFFEMASDRWEPPTDTERAAWNLVDV